ncbi:MFS transporter [Kosmotoga pacifica]|uniref:Major facilitator superfamily (MFS) profile domain-containing protein n=1 Tax=Kosmotoga pacifica TaxID=1330330 RepID=A0A0G2ZCE5_9BACT|nr:MFS transporter [Kosmotoga pacifica]AKI97776.1 hypothetical protein IX53_08070 [Kosmotoga pacifica]
MHGNDRDLERNIPLFYIYHFISQIRVDNVLWLLYMQYRGLGLLEIGICESILHVSALVFEIPTGAVGDLIGRKRSMVIGASLFVLTYTLMFFANSFLAFAIAFFLFGFSMTFISGSDTALIYDTYKALKIETNFKKAAGTFMALLVLGELFSNMSGGLLSRINWAAVYIGAIISRSLYLGLILFLAEPPYKKSDKSLKGYFSLIKNGTLQIFGNTFLRWIFIFWVGISFLGASFRMYSQTYLGSRGLSPFWVSALFTVASLLGIVIAKTAWRIEEAIGRRNFFLLTGLSLAIPMVFYGFAPLGVVIALFLIAGNAENFLDPLMGYYINREVDSAYRATANSIINMGFSIFMAIFFPLMGYFMDRAGYSPVFGMMGLVGIVITLLSLWKFKKLRHL